MVPRYCDIAVDSTARWCMRTPVWGSK